jgi:hypothetical protein
MADEFDALTDMLDSRTTAYATPGDRYRDFRQLFLATAAGQRVLKEILIMGRMGRSCAAKGDPYETYLREGERNLAIRIFNIAHIEPPARPVTQQTRGFDAETEGSR